MGTGKKTLCYFSIDLSNPFGETLLKSVYHRTRIHDLELFVVHGGMINSPNDWEIQRNLQYKWIQGKPVDAILMSNIFSFTEKESIPGFLRPFEHIPIITLAEKIGHIPAILVNNRNGFADLVTDLVTRCGSISIALLTGPANNTDSTERFNILKAVLDEHRITLNPDNIYCGTFGSTSAINGVHELIDVRKASFDTLICFNDYMAITAMEELKRRGYRIPEDVRVTGFDNTYESAFMNPPLTTVEYPIQLLGELGVDYIKRILDGLEVPDTTTLETRFIPRKSSGRISPSNPASTVQEISRPVRGDDDIFADAFFSGHFESFCAEVVGNVRVHVTDHHREWFVSTLKEVLDTLFRHSSGRSGYLIIALERLIYNDHNNEWSSVLWNETFSRLPDRVLSLSPPAYERYREAIQSAGFFSHMHHNSYEIRKLFLLETKEHHLLRMGEDLGTSFNIDSLGTIIESYCDYIGIRDFFAVLYTDHRMTAARLVARIENGKRVKTDRRETFPPQMILPQQLMDTHKSLIMESLYVRNENIGYILFNIGDHPGLLYKNLRHQISSAIKSAQLINTINRYSESLELMVQERTVKLNELNINLKQEIDKRETAEKELLKQKNFESLGLLAGGIAHDFNNILTAISGNISMLQIDDGNPEIRTKLYDGVMKAIGNARNLTQQLLTFSKGGFPVKKAMTVIPLIEETVGFLLRGSAVKAEFVFEAGIKNIEIDPDQISQVVNNIVLNAIHSMPGGGLLKVGAETLRVNDDSAHLAKGEYVKIFFNDTGCGIPESIIDRIFDPYFTTKDKGSGLGLSTSLAIIKKHGGNILVESEKGTGTTFTVYLPTTDMEIEKVTADTGEDIPRNLNILVLEDNEQVQKILTMFLKTTGQNYVCTVDGEDTVREYEAAMKRGKKFDIVITDLTIPGGLGGEQAMARILAIDPDARGIVSTGYSDVPVLADKRAYGFRSSLLKPFTLSDFKKAIREAYR